MAPPINFALVEIMHHSYGRMFIRIHVSIAFALLLMAAAAPSARAFDRGKWLEDYAQLKFGLAHAYANLDSIVDAKSLDLRELDRRTRAEIDRADSDEGAVKALNGLLHEFADGHLRLSPPPVATGTGLSAASPAARTCADAGFRVPRARGLDWNNFPGYEPLGSLDDATFPAGVLTGGSGTRVGIVRIAVFGENAFPAICERLRRGKTECGPVCEQEIFAEAGREITAALARQLKAVRQKPIDAMVVDITGNGGGTDWVEAAMRTVAAPGLASPRIAFIKHAHWIKHFDNRIADLDIDLKRSDLPAALRTSLELARKAAIRERSRAASPCDRSAIWLSGPEALAGGACPLLVNSEFFSSGYFSARPDFALGGLESGWVLFHPDQYPDQDGAYRGPLAILIDDRVASSAELFAAALKDGAGATLIGMRTRGAGCGYTNGGIAITLKHSGIRLHVPDCARLRRDGSNEVLGVVPDRAVRANTRESYATEIERWVRALPGPGISPR